MQAYLLNYKNMKFTCGHYSEKKKKKKFYSYMSITCATNLNKCLLNFRQLSNEYFTCILSSIFQFIQFIQQLNR